MHYLLGSPEVELLARTKLFYNFITNIVAPGTKPFIHILSNNFLEGRGYIRFP